LQVVLNHARAFAAEFGWRSWSSDGREQFLRRLRPARFMTGRSGEEGALEGVALHAELQLLVARLLAGDLEGVEVEDLDFILEDEA
jgi:hypothetical protein